MSKPLSSYLLAIAVFAISTLLSYALPAHAEIIHQPHLEAQLVSEYQQLLPGKDATFALRLAPHKDWHVYWKNPGDTGAAPILSWLVDNQSVDTEELWPVPERIRVGPFVNYGYSREVYIIATLPIPDNHSESVEIKLDAEWLVCQEECIPGHAVFSKTIQFTDELLPSKHKVTFDQMRAQLPAHRSDLAISVSQTDNSLSLNLTNFSNLPTQLEFIPETRGIISNSAKQQFKTIANGVALRLSKDNNFTSPVTLKGLLLKTPPWSDGSPAHAIEVTIPTGPEATKKTVRDSVSGMKKAGSLSLLTALLFAYIGGLILNLMPCVFPVLSIKVLSFVKKAGNDPAKIRMHGLLFALGILVSFWTLALLVRSIHLAGDGLGWGFQLQNPTFVALLILLLVAVAMNLFGLYEFGLALQRISSKMGGQSESYGTSFGSGVLATVLATPCTAPFMGAALAYAMVSGFAISIAVFTALALGLATPYLLLSFFPGWLSRLPRPGEWMNTFRQLMGFPILATALWLAWVFEKQSGGDKLIELLTASFLLALTLWIYGKATLPSRKRLVRIAGNVIALAGIMASIGMVLPPCCNSGKIAKAATPAGTADSHLDSYGLRWQSYSKETVKELVASGTPVFLDFTAAWCVTCQLNKKVVFGSQEVREAMSNHGVALVKGDWTNRNPEIKEALAEFGKIGVPLNILYNPDRPDEPTVFPSLLTPALVLSALRDLNN